jgi:hypothetical protein
MGEYRDMGNPARVVKIQEYRNALLLRGCVIVALQGCVIVTLQGCVIVALQGCIIVLLQGND